MKILIGRGRSHQPPWVGTGSEALTQATGVFTLVLLELEKTYEIYSNTRNRLRFRWVSCRVMKILIGRGCSHQPPWVGTRSEALTQATGVNVHPKTGRKALNTAIYWMAGGVTSVESNPPTPSWYPILCLPRGARIQRSSYGWWR